MDATQGLVDSEVVLQEETPHVAKGILSRALAAAIGQNDTKVVFDITLLNEKMTALERENKELRRQHAEMKHELENAKQERDEMYQYLHSKLDQKVEIAKRLESELQTTREQLERQVEMHEAYVKKIENEHEQEIMEMKSQVERQSAEVNNLLAFAEEKDRIEGKVAQLEALLSLKSAEWQEEKTNIERESLIDREKLRRKLLAFQTEHDESELIERGSKEEICQFMKRMKKEKAFMVQQLTLHSEETEKIMAKQKELEAEVQQLKVRARVAEGNASELVKRSHHLAKIVRNVSKDASEGSPENTSVVETACEDTPSVLTESTDQYVQELEVALQKARKCIQAFQKERAYLVTQQDEVVQFLLRALYESSQLLQQEGDTKVDSVEANKRLSTLALSDRMDDLVAQLPPISVDELGSSQIQFLLKCLVKKIQVYQERIALIYQKKSPVRKAEQEEWKGRRGLLEKQLGVQLPPLSPIAVKSYLSPLKQHRRIFQLDGSFTNLTENRHKAHSNKAVARSMKRKNQELLVMATHPFNFTSAVSTKPAPKATVNERTPSPVSCATTPEDRMERTPVSVRVQVPYLSNVASEDTARE